MRDRIKTIIELENISYSKFADIIGIQRSGVSHILSGRNNPSLEVVQKILESFEYLNTDWLLFGKGEMKKYEKQGILFNESPDNPIITEKKENTEEINSKSDDYSEKDKDDDQIFHSAEDKIRKHEPEKISSNEIEKEITKNEEKNSTEKVERIVIFFNNNTFKEYHPD